MIPRPTPITLHGSSRRQAPSQWSGDAEWAIAWALPTAPRFLLRPPFSGSARPLAGARPRSRR
eukprot:6343262-Alexandrium_andersonii.AAC.1